jgi:Peptidase A4 family
MFPSNESQWDGAEHTPSARPPRQPRRGGLVATIAGVAVFGALIGFAADRWAVINFSQNPLSSIVPTTTTTTGPRVGPVAAPNGAGTTAQAAPTTTSSMSSDPTQQAIQQAIQKGDQEQAQALASNDPTVMQDTSTSDFYQTQVTTNQDLRANGVSDIKLVGIDWGPISVNGASATATAFETWSTTYTDGTTEQSRDRNVYTLVQQNGAWVISADDHPDDNVGGTTPGATVPGQGNGGTPGQRGGGAPGVTTPGGRSGGGTGNPGSGTQPTNPRVPSQDVSQNWSGYAATGGTFSAVSGSWTVPQFAPDSPAGADAAWIGIGGVNTRDLIQAGTQQTVSGSGSTQYQAWVETLPQASHPVPLAVNPGDTVSLSISQVPQAQDQWQVSFTNNTTGQTYQVTEHYQSSMSSAEWIEEAPSAMRGRQLPLDTFGSISFSQGSTVKDGQTVNIASSGAQPITMISRGNRAVARPSTLAADGAGFTVTQS